MKKIYVASPEQRIVVTSGSSYLDIDAYGGCIAYAELLKLQGYKAVAFSSAPLNESITPTVRSWHAKLDCYTSQNNDQFALIDISNPAFFDPVVVSDRIAEIIDHHPGFEQYWQDKLGTKADIEFIGAACTQIYERWQAAGLLGHINHDTARLLATGILDNTLNFQAKVTTDRDRAAYKSLAEISSLAANWPLQYFSECQALIEANLETAISNDVKILGSSSYLPNLLGQLVVWDARPILERKRNIIAKVFEAKGTDWALNLVSISEGKSYFLSSTTFGQSNFSKLLGLTFCDGVAMSKNLWIRKEIFRRALEA